MLPDTSTCPNLSGAIAVHAYLIAQRTPRRRAAALLPWLLLGFCGVSFALGDAQTPSSGAWEYLQKQFYPDRDIGLLDERYMSLEAPANTPDPAATPLTLRF